MLRGIRRLQPFAAVAVAAALLAACGGSPSSSHSTGTSNIAGGRGQFGHLPHDKGTQQKGGVVTIAETPGSSPTYIFPITPGTASTVYDADQFQDYMWRPLWWGPNGDIPEFDLSQSIASGPPSFSDHNKTVKIHLRSTWKWSDGKPVTAEDCIFFIDILKAAVKISAANYGPYTPGLFPDFISSMSAPNATTLVLHLKATYNQSFLYYDQLALIVPLPAQAWAIDRSGGPLLNYNVPANATRIYNYLNDQSDKLSTYATNPIWQVVDGPYRLKSFDSATGGNTFVANTHYTGPIKPHITEIDDVSYTSVNAEFIALETGALDVGFVDFTDLSEVAKLKNYYVWGYPDFGFNFITYNFLDKTGHFNRIIAQLYFRQALAHTENESAIITSRGAFDGAAGQSYGPVPAVPKSPFAPANALSNPYPYSMSTAAKILKAHGWKIVPNGLSRCVRPGSGPKDCGKGIPKGTPLRFNLYYASSPAVIGTQCEIFASDLKSLGIEVQLISKTFDFILSTYDDVATPKTDNDWAMQDYGGFTDSYYPTTNEIFNTTGAYNGGLYSDPKANALIHASVTSLNSDAVKTELEYITAQQPGLFQPNGDIIMAFKKTLAGPAKCFADSSQFQLSPECWYFKKT